MKKGDIHDLILMYRHKEPLCDINYEDLVADISAFRQSMEASEGGIDTALTEGGDFYCMRSDALAVNEIRNAMEVCGYSEIDVPNVLRFEIEGDDFIISVPEEYVDNESCSKEFSEVVQ